MEVLLNLTAAKKNPHQSEDLKSKGLKNQFLIKELLTINFFKTEVNGGAFEPNCCQKKSPPK